MKKYPILIALSNILLIQIILLPRPVSLEESSLSFSLQPTRIPTSLNPIKLNTIIFLFSPEIEIISPNTKFLLLKLILIFFPANINSMILINNSGLINLIIIIGLKILLLNNLKKKNKTSSSFRSLINCKRELSIQPQKTKQDRDMF